MKLRDVLAILTCGLGFGPLGCGMGDGEKGILPPNDVGPNDPAARVKKVDYDRGHGPAAPGAPIDPSPVPSLPTNPRGDMDKPDATRPGGLPSEDSKKEGARPPATLPGETPSAPK